MALDSLSIDKSGFHRFISYLLGMFLFFIFVIALSHFLCSIVGEELFHFDNSYLLKWITFVVFILSIPSLYLLSIRRFQLFHPLVYPVWVYFFPAFILGSLYFATGKYDPYYLTRIAEPDRYIPLALFYVALGYASLSIGFAMNVAKKIGHSVAFRLPKWNWDIGKMTLPFLLLLAIGRVFELSAFAAGAVGFQQIENSTSVGSTYYFFSILGYMAYFLLWLSIFKSDKLRPRQYVLILLLVMLIPYSVMISGSKGEFLRNLIAILFAYWSSGRTFRFRHGIIAGCLFVSAILVGVTYGTMFRIVKGDESRVSFAENYEILNRTLDAVRDINPVENLGLAVENTFRRFETITSLSVIVANYEQLRPLEDDYGIANNIWTYTWTAFIPRIVWPGKPVVSDARSIGILYFGYGDSSPAITPMGDLLRNYGPLGVPLGMALLGFVLRIIYSALIEGQDPSAWRSVAYYLLLTTISYESFFGTILPGLLRVGLVVLIGGILMNKASIIREATEKVLHAYRLNRKALF